MHWAGQPVERGHWTRDFRRAVANNVRADDVIGGGRIMLRPVVAAAVAIQGALQLFGAGQRTDHLHRFCIADQPLKLAAQRCRRRHDNHARNASDKAKP